MKSVWLNKQNNKKVIVYFSGWGTDETTVKHLNCENFDVLMFYDYENVNSEMPDFSKYDEKYLICWSAGVCVSSLFYEEFKDFDKLIAINGCRKMADDKYAIPELIYKLTVENFNELSCGKFMKKISENESFKNYRPRSNEELKQELISLQKITPEKYLKFDKAYISTKDRIIPVQNQRNLWRQTDAEIVETETGHYIFDSYGAWSELL